MHKKSVYILQRILENIGKGMSLIEAYQSEYLEEEGDPVVKVGNRKVILDYLKMVGRFVRKWWKLLLEISKFDFFGD